jgi:hypothetical protein
LAGDGTAHEQHVSMYEPGLDLHEWETRWAELEDALAEDPADALVEACDEIEELLGVREADAELTSTVGDLVAALESARETANRIERGEDVDPGDIGAAVENLRLIRRAIGPGIT